MKHRFFNDYVDWRNFLSGNPTTNKIFNYILLDVKLNTVNIATLQRLINSEAVSSMLDKIND